MYIASSNLHEIIDKILNEPVVLLGFAGQACFFLRFLIQWIISEKKGKSVVPTIFWYISLAGAAIVFVYGWIVAEPILVVGQLGSSFVYIRNLILIYARKPKPAADYIEPFEKAIKIQQNELRSISEINNEIIRLEKIGRENEAKTLRWVLINSTESG